MLAAYFASKMIFVKMPQLSSFQILNQFVLWGLLYVLFQIFVGLESRLKAVADTKWWTPVKFVADRTLEIYLVQYVILDHLKIGPFPLNWLLLTATILVAAVLLRYVSQLIIKRIDLK